MALARMKIPEELREINEKGGRKREKKDEGEKAECKIKRARKAFKPHAARPSPSPEQMAGFASVRESVLIEFSCTMQLEGQRFRESHCLFMLVRAQQHQISLIDVASKNGDGPDLGHPSMKSSEDALKV